MSDERRPLERCFWCNEPTGRAGAGEDSLYSDEESIGPWCERCWDDMRRSTADDDAAKREGERAARVATLTEVIHAALVAQSEGRTPEERFEAFDRYLAEWRAEIEEAERDA